MGDRELLELAARAAGIELDGCEDNDGNMYLGDHMTIWNPLKFDAAALRLAVKLDLLVDFKSRCAMPPDRSGHNAKDWLGGVINDPYLGGDGDDPYAATRRAIVRAAAEIGRSMK